MSDGPEVRRRRAELYDRLVSCGHLPADWRPAYWAVPRHAFIPERVWIGWRDRDARRPLDRRAEPDTWWDLVYDDDVVATQYDGGGAAAGEVLTSSASMPSIVFGMLADFDAEPGHRVLEIGTGTGWNAALLGARLGDTRVTTVEIDPALAARAKGALGGLGQTPTLVVGDGRQGHPGKAPYDRIIATASITTVPYAWVEQAAPGAVIVAPMHNAYDTGGQLRLVVADDGTATGRFTNDSIAFMPLRTAPGRLAHPCAEPPPTGWESTTTTDVWPGEFYRDGASFAIGWSVPDAHAFTESHDDGRIDTWYAHDPASSSWARVRFDRAPMHVDQSGPRRLFEEVAAAHRRWVNAGRPRHDAFEVRVTASRQTITVPGGPAVLLGAQAE